MAATPHRCEWAGTDPDYVAYHDHEWGVPVHDDQRLFEMLVLEGFQAGLSWLTILKKRAAFREAFLGWDISAVAGMNKRQIEACCRNPAIVRNRLKIDAAVNNGRCVLEIQGAFGTFDAYLWRFTDGKTLTASPRYRSWKEIPTTSKEAEAMSRDLKTRGFKFVGPTICYSYMQACGLVDDHVAGCICVTTA